MVRIIDHCNPFVLVCHFVEKWTCKFSLTIKGENVVNVNECEHKTNVNVIWAKLKAHNC